MTLVKICLFGDEDINIHIAVVEVDIKIEDQRYIKNIINFNMNNKQDFDK
jgi:hypothetical protein